MNYNNKIGGFQLSVNNNTQFYEHQSGKNSFYYSLSYYGSVKKFSWNGNLTYTPTSYTINSKSKNRGGESDLVLQYRLNSHFRINAGLRYYLGMLTYKTFMDEGTYHSMSYEKIKDRRYRVLFGFSYYLQKRQAPNRMKKYLNSTEGGISL